MVFDILFLIYRIWLVHFSLLSIITRNIFFAVTHSIILPSISTFTLYPLFWLGETPLRESFPYIVSPLSFNQRDTFFSSLFSDTINWVYSLTIRKPLVSSAKSNIKK